MKTLRGTGVALVTPFDENNNIDEIALAKVVNYAIKCGVDYLVVLGTTAEVSTLKPDEKEKVKLIIEETNNNRLPMVLGIGGNDTDDINQQIKKADLTKYEAILSVSPHYNLPTQEGIYQHYKSLAEHSNHPLIIYNVPSRTGSNVLPSTTLRLAHDCDNIIGIKEASPSFVQALEVIKNKPKQFLFLSGSDILAPSTTLAGGDGTISVIGQAIPEYSSMINAALNKNADETYSIFYKILPLIESIYKEGNPNGVKALLEYKNVCSRFTRLPIVPATDSLYKEIVSNTEFK